MSFLVDASGVVFFAFLPFLLFVLCFFDFSFRFRRFRLRCVPEAGANFPAAISFPEVPKTLAGIA